MTRRFFWQLPEFIRYRIVFENAETVLGVNDNREHRLFRKDTSRILFAENNSTEYEEVPPEQEADRREAVCV